MKMKFKSKEMIFIFHYNRLQSWRQNGKRHREKGPSLIYSNGYMSWYLNGKSIKVV